MSGTRERAELSARSRRRPFEAVLVIVSPLQFRRMLGVDGRIVTELQGGRLGFCS